MSSDELLIRIDERQRHMDETLDEVLTQTKKTNGRVDKLEERTDQIDERIDKHEMEVRKSRSFRDKFDGGWKTVVAIVGTLGFLISTILHFV